MRFNEVGVSRFGCSEVQPSETVKSLLVSPNVVRMDFSATFGEAEKSKVSGRARYLISFISCFPNFSGISI